MVFTIRSIIKKGSQDIALPPPPQGEGGLGVRREIRIARTTSRDARRMHAHCCVAQSAYGTTTETETVPPGSRQRLRPHTYTCIYI